MLLPCGHGGYCGACAHSFLALPLPFRLCPVCRAALTQVVRVRLSTLVGAVMMIEANVSPRRGPSQQSTSGLPAETAANALHMSRNDGPGTFTPPEGW